MPAPVESTFFQQDLQHHDRAVWDAIAGETRRLNQQIELIASENLVSAAVLEAQGSVLTNKYAEGYPGRRYYGGCEFMDTVESLAIERAQRLFDCPHVNVQPHSGAQANAAVLFALCKPGDTIMGMALDAGGHLTHGAAPTVSGKWFRAVSYTVRREDSLIDYDQVEELARRHKPMLLIAGGSAYPRTIDFARFRAIADSCGAMLMVDMAHFAGLVAAGVHPSPIPHAHVVTTTTHKTLRGPRGGMIFCSDPQLAKRINSAVFPGTQGGPLMHVIAAKAVALGEALQPEFREYGQAVVDNANTLAETLLEGGCALIAGGTDTHLLLMDLRPQGITGKAAEALLEKIGITCNKNTIPFDPQKPAISSGIRLGTPATTSRGFRAAEFRLIGETISRALNNHAQDPQSEDRATVEELRRQMLALCERFPVYPHRQQVRKSA